MEIKRNKQWIEGRDPIESDNCSKYVGRDWPKGTGCYYQVIGIRAEALVAREMYYDPQKKGWWLRGAQCEFYWNGPNDVIAWMPMPTYERD